jgi:thiosulfate reductase cytochrome b subunit
VALVHFFPREFYDLLNLNGRLAEGMAIHFFVMWFFALNGLLYVLFTLFSGQWRFLVPNRRSFRDAWLVFVNDLGLSRLRPPQRKFNGAQQIAYTLVILMAAGSLATGLAIYQPVQFGWLTALLGGYEWARWEHFWLAAGFVLFIFIHVVQVIRAGWNNCRSMITGYEIVPTGETAHGKQEPASARLG